eukprot:1600079-Heterocapsa_arctica.AAC.1
MVYLLRTHHRPRSSDVTERFVGMVAGGARCLLAQSGLLAARWPYAARAFCHAKDIKIGHLNSVVSNCAHDWMQGGRLS